MTATLLPVDSDLPGDELDPMQILGLASAPATSWASRAACPPASAAVGPAVHGRSIRDLATSLGTSEKAVNALTHRGRTTMHQRVDASV